MSVLGSRRPVQSSWNETEVSRIDALGRSVIIDDIMYDIKHDFILIYYDGMVLNVIIMMSNITNYDIIYGMIYDDIHRMISEIIYDMISYNDIIHDTI